MEIAIFGLGRMGMQIAKRLHQNDFTVYAWNRSIEPRKAFEAFIIPPPDFRSKSRKADEEVEFTSTVSSVYSLGAKGEVTSHVLETVPETITAFKGPQRVFWVMLPNDTVEQFIFEQLLPHLKPGDIVIDGGNSFYKDSIRRGQKLAEQGIHFYDCGTSGGVWGLERGFALMVGGPREQWDYLEPIFKTLSSGDNYALLGRNGAGHFVKMVHNGIEYGMMQAIGEGYAVMEASEFDLNFKDVTRVYQKGSVISSWLIDLTRNIYEHEDIANTSGIINATGEGEWTINTAKELGVDVPVIENSFKVRQQSKDSKNQNSYSNKIVALLRKQFGGHAIETYARK